jgi:hypothetical protein
MIKNNISKIQIARCPNNPLIDFISSVSIGKNVNGPSVIKVPDWIKNPLGKYYMYFGHHGGQFIRLAYADCLEGPWTVYEPGVLPLDKAVPFTGHIASPDVHVDHEKQQIRLYFHACVQTEEGLVQQMSGVAFSANGLAFNASDQILGKFYFKVFQWQNNYYAIAKNWNSGFGELYRSVDGIGPFESRGDFIPMMRHVAVLKKGDQLLIFYSRKGDCPERILVSILDLTKDWTIWQESDPIDVIKPELDYEGIKYPLKPSNYGPAIEVQELRDPCVYEEDGKIYLFYSTAGEMGIAMAELKIYFA